jgi:hypothetical protein
LLLSIVICLPTKCYCWVLLHVWQQNVEDYRLPNVFSLYMCIGVFRANFQEKSRILNQHISSPLYILFLLCVWLPTRSGIALEEAGKAMESFTENGNSNHTSVKILCGWVGTPTCLDNKHKKKVILINLTLWHI